jgi:hypothetical protein
MNNDSYKAWIDAMPIDDVRRRIERLERKLSDLHVLERLYEERHGSGEPAHEADPAPEHEADSESGAPEGEADSEGGAREHEADSEGGAPEHEADSEGGAPEGGGGWTHGEDAPEHG